MAWKQLGLIHCWMRAFRKEEDRGHPYTCLEGVPSSLPDPWSRKNSDEIQEKLYYLQQEDELILNSYEHQEHAEHF
jgi:hypothetical protein